MNRWVSVAVCLLIAGALAAPAAAHAQTGASAPATPTFDRLVGQFLDQFLFKFNPTQATLAGVHQYDAQLEDWSKEGIEAQRAAAKRFQAEFAKIDANTLSPGAQGDLQLIRNFLASSLLELESIRGWEQHPDEYTTILSRAAWAITSRNYASPTERLRALVARQRHMPKLLEAARANLNHPPRERAYNALADLPQISVFFQKDVPAAFKQVKDRKLLAEFRQANEAVLQALREYADFLAGKMLPLPKKETSIGAENFSKKLLHEEMLDLPPERLMEIAQADLEQNRKQFLELAARLDAKRTPQDILYELSLDHPSVAKLRPAYNETFTALQAFITGKNLLTVPASGTPVLEDTPTLLRRGPTVSLQLPGPFEKKAGEALLFVSTPDPRSTPRQADVLMRAFNRSEITQTAIHDVYPGRYTQFLWSQRTSPKVGGLLGARGATDGWALYCEQMMLDEGFGNSPTAKPGADNSFLKLRLLQLHRALLQDVRAITSISMHAGKMTWNQAMEPFMKDAYISVIDAENEARRVAFDPMMIAATLGKLQILKLRGDYKKLKGDKFNLREFHDQFLKHGTLPIPAIRLKMLGEAGSAL